MDPKASAKSKRIHSQHGRKNHPSPSAIAQKKKQEQQHRPATGGSVGEAEKPKRPSGRSLPSNWDRYDDDSEAGIEVGGEKLDDVEAKYGEVAPKSRGADFRHLVEEARSQSVGHRHVGLQGSSSIELLPIDFMQGLSSILAVKGEGLLDLCQHDNFIIDDDPTSSYEAPFLSLDLHAITEHLSKLKPSQRLFVEDDLLPGELCEESREQFSEETETTIQVASDDCPTSQTFVKETISEHGMGAQFDSCMFNTNHDMKIDLNMTENSQNIVVQESSSEHGIQVATSAEQNRMPKFEAAAAAEAELDMLLDSQIETKISRSPVEAPRGSLMLDSLTTTASSSIGTDRTSSGATSFLDQDLDDLLAEKSLNSKNKGTSLTQDGVEYSKNHFPSNAASASLSETAYKRNIAASAALDDALDDLLADTYIQPEDLLNTARLQNKETAAANLPSTSSCSQKPVDDFDSWFDTIQ